MHKKKRDRFGTTERQSNRNCCKENGISYETLRKTKKIKEKAEKDEKIKRL